MKEKELLIKGRPGVRYANSRCQFKIVQSFVLKL